MNSKYIYIYIYIGNDNPADSWWGDAIPSNGTSYVHSILFYADLVGSIYLCLFAYEMLRVFSPHGNDIIKRERESAN